MKLLIDLQCCQSGSRLGGIGRYSLDLAKGMVRQSNGREVLVAINDRYPQSGDEVRAAFRGLLPPDNVRVFSIPPGVSYFHRNERLTEAAEILREDFIRRLNPDAVHISSLFEGLGDDVVTSIGRLSNGPVTAVTLYDLIPYLQQDKYLGDPTARKHYFDKFAALQRADALFGISQFSSDEGARILPNYRGVIANIRGGIDPGFVRLKEPPASTQRLLSKFGVRGPFLLYTASFDQRKNQAGLIQAFARVKAAARHGYKLVIVGNGTQPIYDELKSWAARHGLNADDVVFTGRVADDDLIGLYNLCSLFVFASLWEGLGLPVLEAMACGAPVISSNTTSLPEVVGLEEAEFDPTDIEEMSQRIEAAITDSSFRARLVAHGLEHSRNFTWDESARRAWAAVERARDVARATRPQIVHSKSCTGDDVLDALASQQLREPQLREISHCLAANELQLGAEWSATDRTKIGWVSSWGTRCGIASYSRHLVERLDSDVVVLAPEVSGRLPFGTTPFEVCWSQGKSDPLDQLSATIDRLELTTVVIQFNYGFYDFPALVRLITRQARLNRSVFITLHATVDPPPHILKDRLEDIKVALALCDGVFVHSRHDVERLAAIGISENVIVIPQGVNIPDTHESRSARGRRRIASYGFFLPGKGLAELVQAIGLLVADGVDLELLMVNACYADSGGISQNEIDAVRRLATKLDLEDRITFITDYLEDAESVAHLATADLVVYAYQRTGESSSAAVRTGLASQAPIAVTPLPIFDDVANVTLPLPGITPNEIAAGIKHWLGELSRETQQVKERSEAAALWRRANDVAAVAAYTRNVLRLKAASTHWQIVDQRSASDMLIASGRLEGGCIKAGGQSGVAIYGPYISLAPGAYRLRVRGRIQSRDAEEVGRIELTSEMATRIIADFPFTQLGEFVCDEVVWVERPSSAVEVRFTSSANGIFEIESWQLSRRNV